MFLILWQPKWVVFLILWQRGIAKRASLFIPYNSKENKETSTMNNSNHSNKPSSDKSNSISKHHSFSKCSNDTAVEKKRCLSDSCIDVQMHASKDCDPSITAKSNPEHFSNYERQPREPSQTISSSVIYLHEKNVPLPAAFFQGDDCCHKKSKLNNNICINMPENFAGAEEPPLPTPLYDMREGMEQMIASDKLKAKCYNSRNINNSPECATHQSRSVERIIDSRSSYNTNKSYCSSTKDRLSSKSSHTELAVAQPIREDDIYEATHYEPFTKQQFYRNRKCYFVTFTVLLTIAVLTAIAVYFSTKRPCCEFKNGAQTPAMTAHELMIHEFIEEYALERNAQISNIKSTDARHKALTWLLHEDGLRLAISATNLMQRYILAVLAFSFDIFSWDCGMVHGLPKPCNDNETEPYDLALWLSATDECHWYGVTCQSGTVKEIDLSKFVLLVPSRFIITMTLLTLLLGGTKSI